LTIEEQELLACLGCSDLYLSAADDPDDMEDLVEDLLDLEYEDPVGEYLCAEVLAAVLRKNAFDVDQAADAIERAYAPDPCPTSVPGHWQLCARLTRGPLCDDGSCDPPEMRDFVTALRGLPLTDRRGRPFCDQVIAAAVRSYFYDPLEAADYLLLAADRIHGRPRSSNADGKRAAYAKLAERFTGDYVYSDHRKPEVWHMPVGSPIPPDSEYKHRWG
jgi:hypothetical protein